MNTLVHFGAPKSILVDGKPHLGTDRLVPLLRNFRQHLQSLGVSFIVAFHPLKLLCISDKVWFLYCMFSKRFWFGLFLMC